MSLPAVNLVSDVVFVERFGEVVYASTSVVVVIPSGSTSMQARALGATGVPAVGDKWSNDYPRLKVEERTVHHLGNDGTNNKAKISLIYRLSRDAGSTSAKRPLRGGATLQQQRTQLDRSGDPIVVSYTLPGEGNEPDPKGASVDVLNPQQTTYGEFVTGTPTPDNIVGDWVGFVNADQWRGGEPGDWLCVSGEYELINAVPASPIYVFKFEFEKSDQADKIGNTAVKGWDYIVAYQDANKEIPSDVTFNNGLIAVEWHDSRLFGPSFGSTA